MPKATWGSDLDEEAIDSAESRTAYAGPLPPAGVYRFKLRWLRKSKSKQGNPMVRFFGVLDGTYRDDHKKFDGAPLFVDTAVMASTAFRIKALVQGLGVTSKQFMSSTTTDDAEPDPNILKIGTKKITDGMAVYVHVKQEDDNNGNPRLTVVGGGFVPAPDEDGYVLATGAADPAEEDGGKKKKDKKGKKAKGGDKPPF